MLFVAGGFSRYLFMLFCENKKKKQTGLDDSYKTCGSGIGRHLWAESPGLLATMAVFGQAAVTAFWADKSLCKPVAFTPITFILKSLRASLLWWLETIF